MAASGTDLGRLVITVEARTKAIEKQLDALVKQAANDAGTIENRWQRAGKAFENAGNSAKTGGDKVVASVGQQRAAISNLSFQLNDLTQGLMAGTSPFTLMTQQGGQVVQALQQSGGGIKGLLSTIGGAAAMVVNPFSLATYAVIGLTAAATQYFGTIIEKGKDAETVLKAQKDVIDQFDEVWGYAEIAVKSYTQAQKDLAIQKLKDQLGDLNVAAVDARKAVSFEGTKLQDSVFDNNINKAQEFNRVLEELNQEIPNFRAVAEGMLKFENGPEYNDELKAIAKNVRMAALEHIPLQDALEEIDRRQRAVNNALADGKAAMEALASAALGLGKAGPEAVGIVVDKVQNSLIPSLTTAAQKVVDLIKEFGNLQNQVNQTQLGVLPPVYSYGGNFTNQDGGPLNPNMPQTGLNAEQQRVVDGVAFKLIKGFEGILFKAQRDFRESTGAPDRWRVGFGSDTKTDLQGNKSVVTPDTTVTLAEAQADLVRRIAEAQAQAISQIGVERFKSLDENQQAAVASIVYNYGKIPQKIADLFNAGASDAEIAQEWAKLGKVGVNRPRRIAEARLFASGVQGGGSIISDELRDPKKEKQTPAQIFTKDLEESERRAKAMQAELDALNKLNPLIKDYGYQKAYAAEKQRLLNEAEKAGIELTPEWQAKIEALASSHAQLESAQQRTIDNQQKLAKSAQEFADAAKDAISGFVQDLMAGKDAAEALRNVLGKLATNFLNKGLDMLFNPPAAGGAGLFGSLAKIFFPFAAGGKVRGPGTGKSDDILARLSNGEFVVNAKATEEFEPLLKAINSGKAARLASGGKIGKSAPSLGRRGMYMGGKDELNIVLQDDSGRMAEIADRTVAMRAGGIVRVSVDQANKSAPSAVAKRQMESAGSDYRL